MEGWAVLIYCSPNNILFAYQRLKHSLSFPQTNPVRTFQTSETSITIENLDSCTDYWVAISAVDCSSRLGGNPMLVGLFEPTPFKFVISLDENTNCRSWIADNMDEKISGVQGSLRSALDRTSCTGAGLPCLATSQFVCGTNPSTVNYE